MNTWSSGPSTVITDAGLDDGKNAARLLLRRLLVDLCLDACRYLNWSLCALLAETYPEPV